MNKKLLRSSVLTRFFLMSQFSHHLQYWLFYFFPSPLNLKANNPPQYGSLPPIVIPGLMAFMITAMNWTISCCHGSQVESSNFFRRLAEDTLAGRRQKLILIKNFHLCYTKIPFPTFLLLCDNYLECRSISLKNNWREKNFPLECISD